MTKLPEKGRGGFTLFEMVSIILIVTILATMALSLREGTENANRYEATRVKMEALKRAIVGDDKLESGGSRANFGYHGDMGTLPPSLVALTAPQTPAWTFIGSLGIGAGWRGPYIVPQFPDPYGILTDAWGNAFVYSTTSITSFGADGVAGGASYNQDLTVTLDTGLRLSKVRGVIQDGQTRLSGETASLYYPTGGFIITSSATTDTNGFFEFDSVPFGARAIQVTNSPGLGPRSILVDGPEYLIPNDRLNFFGSFQKVTVDTSSAACASHLQHRINLTNTYATLGTLQNITVWWLNTSHRLNTVVLNSVANGVGSVASGTRLTLATALTLPANSTRSLELRWSGKMDLQDIDATLEWSQTTDPSRIAWITTTCANPSIAVNNPQNFENNGSASNIALAYTVPLGLASPTLIVGGGGMDDKGNQKPTSATFGPTSMNLATSLTGSRGGQQTGLALYWLATTAGQFGTVTLNFPGNLHPRFIQIYSLNSTDQTGPSSLATAVSSKAPVTTSLSVLNEYSMVASAGSDNQGNDEIAVGTDHVRDINQGQDGAAFALGHISVDLPRTITGTGWDNTQEKDMLEILASILYTP